MPASAGALATPLPHTPRGWGRSAPSAWEPGISETWDPAAERLWPAYGPIATQCTLSDVARSAPPGSAALAAYLRRVYGPTADAHAGAWDWGRVEMIWLDALPPALSNCSWPLGPLGPDSVFVDPTLGRARRSVWRYAHAGVCRNDALNDVWPPPQRASAQVCQSSAGGPRGTATVLEAGQWLEVSHTAHLGWTPFEVLGFWMYKAAGSGLWYRLGRTLVVADLLDLARYMNLSYHDGYDQLKDDWHGARRVNKYSLIAEVRRSRRFETLVFTHHVDPGFLLPSNRGRGFYRTEVLGLRQKGGRAHLACPNDPTMAWGWQASRAPCRCVPTGSAAAWCNPMSRSSDGAAAKGADVYYPVRHIQCDTSGTARASTRACAPAPTLRVNGIELATAACAEGGASTGAETAAAVPLVLGPNFKCRSPPTDAPLREICAKHAGALGCPRRRRR